MYKLLPLIRKIIQDNLINNKIALLNETKSFRTNFDKLLMGIGFYDDHLWMK